MTAFINLKTATAIGILTLGLAGCSQPADDTSATDTAAAEQTAETHDDASAHDEHEMHDEHAEHDDHAGHDHAEHEAHDSHEGHEHHHDHDHDHADMTTYNCQPEQMIEAHYDDHDGQMSAHLLIDGIEYDLLATSGESTDPAVGDIYDTDIGLMDDAGMRWEVTADKMRGTLVSLPTADTQGSDETVLFECEVAQG